MRNFLSDSYSSQINQYTGRKQTNLSRFLSSISFQLLQQMRNFIQRQQFSYQSRCKDKRKITLYEDILAIVLCKQKQYQIFQYKYAFKDILNQLAKCTGKTVITLEERLKKKICHLNEDQLKFYIKNKKDIQFKGKQLIQEQKIQFKIKMEDNLQNHKGQTKKPTNKINLPIVLNSGLDLYSEQENNKNNELHSSNNPYISRDVNNLLKEQYSRKSNIIEHKNKQMQQKKQKETKQKNKKTKQKYKQSNNKITKKIQIPSSSNTKNIFKDKRKIQINSRVQLQQIQQQNTNQNKQTTTDSNKQTTTYNNKENPTNSNRQTTTGNNKLALQQFKKLTQKLNTQQLSQQVLKLIHQRLQTIKSVNIKNNIINPNDQINNKKDEISKQKLLNQYQ